MDYRLGLMGDSGGACPGRSQPTKPQLPMLLMSIMSRRLDFLAGSKEDVIGRLFIAWAVASLIFICIFVMGGGFFLLFSGGWWM